MLFRSALLFFFQAEDGIRDRNVTGVQTCALPILSYSDFNGNGSIDPSTEIIQERNYYPFGLFHEGYNNVVNGRESNYEKIGRASCREREENKDGGERM